MHLDKFAGVTTDSDRIVDALKRQRTMVDLVYEERKVEKRANKSVYTRRAALMQLLHPEEREGERLLFSHLYRVQSVVSLLVACNKLRVPIAIARICLVFFQSLSS